MEVLDKGVGKRAVGGGGWGGGKSSPLFGRS
jgi:hypothetical protein